jgi:hypothetical protein
MPTVNAKARVYLFGSLQGGLEDRCEQPIQLDLETPTPLVEVLDLLSIPPDKVQMVMVNHRAVHRGQLICPGDRVSVFPKEYPFFPDWKDFRF